MVIDMNVLYTGATSGIAKEVISYLLRDSFVVIYLGVHTKQQLQVMRTYYHGVKNVQILKLDITNVEDYRSLDNIQIDVVVHNAAIGYGGSLFDMPIEKVRENYETNIFGTLQLTQYLFPKFRKQKHGRIIFMSSLAGIIPISFIGSYASSKASLIMIARILKNETRKLDFPLDVILVEPGLYHTGFNQLLFETKYENMKDSIFWSKRGQITRQEKWLLRLLEKNNKKTIARQIYHAIYDLYPKSIYRAPFLQCLGAKIYQILFW